MNAEKRASGSAFERELLRKVANLSDRTQAHDRFVLLGFVFSLLPIFPLVLVGLGLGIFHLGMHRAGKLNDFDGDLARKGLWFAGVNTLLSIAIVAGLVHLASSISLPGILSGALDHLANLLGLFWGPGHIFTHRPGSTV